MQIVLIIRFVVFVAMTNDKVVRMLKEYIFTLLGIYIDTTLSTMTCKPHYVLSAYIELPSHDNY